MNKRNAYKRSTFLVLAILLIGMFLACFVWMRKEQQQNALNRQLIEALTGAGWNTKRALALIEAGADPNTRYKSTFSPSLIDLVNQLLHRSPAPVNTSPTAFMLACGRWLDYSLDRYVGVGSRSFTDPADPALTQAMLLHGADVRLKDERKMTALHYAVVFTNDDIIVKQLLQYGASPDQPDIYGDSAIDTIIKIGGGAPGSLALLRKYSKHP